MASSVHHGHRRQDLLPNEVSQNKEDTQLIWLDANMNNNDDCLLTQSMLLELNPAVQFYSNLDRCLAFIKSIKDEQIFLIVSGALARPVLEKAHQDRTLVAIFIYCSNSQHHLSLLDQYNKIIGIFTDQNSLMESIREKITFIEKQSVGFSLFDQKQKSIKDLSKESAAFLCNQMLIFVLRQMPQDEQAKQEMLQMCRQYYQNNKTELKKISDFDQQYTSAQAIEWYTDECFLYRLLNKALRTEDIDLLYQFRFFIIDLCATIEQDRYRFKDNKKLILYRGTQMSDEELQKLKENVGKIISTNGFLSTSRKIEVALVFARSGGQFSNFEVVMFEIHVDPSVKNVIFADIEDKTRAKGEFEILFTLNSRFKIHSVNFDSKESLWKVQLHATEEGAQLVNEYLELSKHEMEEYSPIIYFGRLLMYDLDQDQKAYVYFNRLLDSLPADHRDIASVYNNIGLLHYKRDESNSALRKLQRAYEIRLKTLTRNHPCIAGSLNNIALVHRRKGNYDLALDCVNTSLTILQKNYPGDHLRKATVLEHIARVYIGKKDFEKALEYIHQALAMFQRILPAQHPHIADCFGPIAYINRERGNWKDSLDYYHRRLTMRDACLPPDHRNFTCALRSIIDTYVEMGETEKALAFCKEKLAVQKSKLGDDHPAVARILIILAKVYEIKEPDQALEYYGQALSIFQEFHPIDHQETAECLITLACLYTKCGMNKKALQCELQALDLERQALPSDHIDIANALRNIGISYQEMKDPSKALDYFNESLSIYRTNYRTDHEYIKRGEEDIAALQLSKLTTSSLNNITYQPLSYLKSDKNQRLLFRRPN